MEQIDVRILDRDYRLAVGPDEKPRLIEAAALVDQTMRTVRDDAGVDERGNQSGSCSSFIV